MTSLSPYHYDFNLSDNSTAALVVNAIGPNKRVLELGCSYGMMTKVMHEQLSCTIVAVDADAPSAAHAKPYTERLLIADLDRPEWVAELAGDQFDAIVAADVLEHLRDPVGCLQAVKPFLKPDGLLVLSIPNVAHNGVLAELLANDFTYRPTGLLDKTHIHLFAWNSITKLLADAGFKLKQVDKTRMDPAVTEFATPWQDLSPLMKSALLRRADGDVYQYILQAVPDGQLDIQAVNSTLAAEQHALDAETEALQAMEARQRDLEQALRDLKSAKQTTEATLATTQAVAGAQILALEADLATATAQLVGMRRSRSWRLTMPFRFLMRTLRHGLLAEDKARLRKLARKAYYKLPLPAFLRRIVWRGVEHYRGAIAGPIKTSIIGFGTSLRATVKPAPQAADLPDYIFWGVIDWHFRQQRPQHLAREISASRRVFYISVLFVDKGQPGFEVEPLDEAGRLFQVKLHVAGAPSVYAAAPCETMTARLRASLGEFLLWSESRRIISVLQYPYWHAIAASLPNSCYVYDCMDHHEGFGNTGADVLALEYEAMERADLTILTSDWLDEMAKVHTQHRTIIRNAGEYDHFATRPGKIYHDLKGRRIIGYYGAIAHWFDTDLIAATAAAFPDCLILLVGADTDMAHEKLSAYANISFTGEVPYAELPFYLYAFDVCLLPFRICPITIATNPVKLYEYLSAGKNVVAVNVPEMRQFDGLIRVADDTPGFIAAVEAALAAPADAAAIAARKAFAQAQTWRHRAEAFIASAESAPRPKVSVVVVTYNNLDFTKACLHSLDQNSDDEALEIIVVDNASADETPAYLQAWAAAPAKGQGSRTIILNPDNKGFAAANNQGLQIATGDYLVMLNNDAYVTPGWAHTLSNHLRDDPTLGLIGPVTNNIGNEAKIEIAYATMDEMVRQSTVYTRRHLGQETPLRAAAFFCVMLARETFRKVGPLDEIFGVGFFEDDDYCRRVEQQGLRIACAEDAFVHHHLSASFNKVKAEARQQLFERNKAAYEKKWGPWVPHQYRAPTIKIPDYFAGHAVQEGTCNVCGRHSLFFFTDSALYRESLTCLHCLTSSRYRSITRGILRAVKDRTGIEVTALANLPHEKAGARFAVYDTQPGFYYQQCAYPMPDLLKACSWVDVTVSQFKPDWPLGAEIAPGIQNQNLECLTFADASLDLVITSDVMEHVRLDERAHRDIHRVLKPGGVYIFTVPHVRDWAETQVRVQVVDPNDPARDLPLLEPEYHGDPNSDSEAGVLSYRTYGLDLDRYLESLGFSVDYEKTDLPESGIYNTELYYCRKVR